MQQRLAAKPIHKFSREQDDGDLHHSPSEEDCANAAGAANDIAQQQGEDRKNSFPAFGIRLLLCLFGGGVVCGNGKGDDGQHYCGAKQEKAALGRDVFVNKP